METETRAGRNALAFAGAATVSDLIDKFAPHASVEPHLSPTPAVLKDPRLDFASHVPEAMRSTHIPVFYSTTRARSKEDHYGNADGGGVTLGFSTLLAGASRLGKPDISDLTVEEIGRLDNTRFQAMDVTAVRGAHEMGGMKGHGYWYANEVISSDVTLSLRYPIPPGERCLESRAAGSRLWRIPENYVDCVAGKLLAAYPELRRR